MGYFSVKVVCRKHQKPMRDMGVMFSFYGTFLPGGISKGRTGSDGWARLYVDKESIGELWVHGKRIGEYRVYKGKTLSVAIDCD